MPRPLREIEPGDYYHVGASGNNRQRIFCDAIDAIDFMRLLAKVCAREAWVIVAYCLMPTHYHLVARFGERGVSPGLQLLNCGFARRSNVRYGRSGHVFRNHSYCGHVESDAHLLQVCRYVVLNPVRARLCSRAEDWRWSSYRACAGLELAPSFVAVGELHGFFAARPGPALAAYKRHVSAGHGPVSDTATAV